LHRGVAELPVRAGVYDDALDTVRTGMSRVIVGQEIAINRILAALCGDGHILLEGVFGDRKDPHGPVIYWFKMNGRLK